METSSARCLIGTVALCGTLVAGCSTSGSTAAPTVTATVTTTVSAAPSSTAPVSGSPAGVPTVTRTVTATASGSQTGATPNVPEGFVGTWDGHSRQLSIDPDGTIRITYRLYVDCTAQRTTQCDRISGNNIYDGGSVTAHVSDVVDATTLYMSVTATTVPADVPYGRVRIGLDTTHDAVAVFGGDFNGLAFCGDTSPEGYCGA